MDQSLALNKINTVLFISFSYLSLFFVYRHISIYLWKIKNILKKIHETKMTLYIPISPLDEFTCKKAQLELNESSNKDDLAKDILIIRQLLSQQFEVKSRIDDEFILSFLRAAKFNKKKTIDLIKGYWLKRIDLKQIFYNRSLENDSKFLKLAELGLLLPLLKLDEEKRRVVVQRPGLWNTNEYTYEDMIKYFFICMDILCEDPMAQINGVFKVL